MIDSCYLGDVRDGLRAFIAGGVRAQTCISSPPYWGLRDYGTAEWEGGDAACDHMGEPFRTRANVNANTGTGVDIKNGAGRQFFREECGKCGARRIDRQIGLERTPDEYVASIVEVFRLVRDVLADDGTLWLNLGDSYCSTPAGNKTPSGISQNTAKRIAVGLDAYNTQAKDFSGLKPKDLVGIPWRVAFALQQPYYAGRIKSEIDRTWFAAMVDGEGCFYIHKRLAGQHAGDGYIRQSDTYSPALEVANTHKAIVERCMALAGVGSISRQDKDRRQPLYRWTARADEAKAIARELYPYLIGKQQQCRIICAMPSNGERAEAAWAAMKLLHAGSPTDVDFAAPTSLHTPGWYLRSDVIWAKPNPMPESVTDRPTKAHEYLFLLAKQERYFYDADAIKEQSVTDDPRRPYGSPGANALDPRGEQGAGRLRAPANVARGGFDGKTNEMPGREAFRAFTETRNRRTVWTVATQPYSEAHFATFPQALVEPCILAGTSQRGHCPACGKGWERVTENVGKEAAGHTHGANQMPIPDRPDLNVPVIMRNVKAPRGWQPTCECNAGAPVPGVVLDPFMGSGTVAQVAQDLGRRWIGCELNPDYHALQTRRAAQRGLELTAAG